MRQVRKGRKSEKEAISRVEKKALQNGMRIAPILQVSLKLQGFENQYMQLEITASLHHFVYGY